MHVVDLPGAKHRRGEPGEFGPLGLVRALSSALNVYAADHFGPRDINWMHASYGLGAALGPLLVTALLRGGFGWRGSYGSLAGMIALVAAVLAATRQRWNDGPGRAVADRSEETSIPAASSAAAPRTWPALAARLGASRVLAGAVASVPVGALVMMLPGPAFAAVAGMMMLGLSTAPIFPLLTLTTSDRVGANATSAVGLQAAASAVGSAVLPSGIGLVIGAVSAWTPAPALLVLSLGMCGVYWLTLRTGI